MKRDIISGGGGVSLAAGVYWLVERLGLLQTPEQQSYQALLKAFELAMEGCR